MVIETGLHIPETCCGGRAGDLLITYQSLHPSSHLNATSAISPSLCCAQAAVLYKSLS